MMTMTEPRPLNARRTSWAPGTGVLYAYDGYAAADKKPFAVVSAETFVGGVARIDVHVERDDERWAAYSDDEFVGEVKRILRERAAALVGA